MGFAGLRVLGGCGTRGNGPTNIPIPAPVDGVLTLPFEDFPELLEAGGWVRGVPPTFGQAVIVIHIGDDLTASSYLSLSAECTHFQCGVNYDDSDRLLKCPCHYSEFELSGAVVRGPAKLPLLVYDQITTSDLAVMVRLAAA